MMRRRRRLTTTELILILVAAVVALFLTYVIVSVRNLSADVESARADRDALIKQVKSLGGKPVVTAKPGEPGQVGPRGDQGPAPSDEQVSRAVALYCLEHTCRGPTGATGRGGTNGKDAVVTPAQVAAAIASYCNARGECAGPSGVKGDKGDSVTGPQGDSGPAGPPPSDDQVAAAVASYCAAHDNCRGPQGEPGTDGQDGKDSTVPGPQGPAGRDGEPPLSWTFRQGVQTYTCTRVSDFDPNAPRYECDSEITP